MSALSGERGAAIAAVLLVAGLAAANVARSTAVPAGWHLAWNVTVAAVAVGVAVAAGLDRAALGLAAEDVPAGLRLGGLAFGAVTIVVVLAALVPASRGWFDDQRVTVDLGAMLVRVLIVIPLGTVLAEELVFRGSLHGLLTRAWGPTPALVLGAVLFGLWHVVPAWRAADGSAPLAAAGTFVATALAGLAFVWLRQRSGSVLAPMLAHLATNSVVFAVAWTVSR